MDSGSLWVSISAFRLLPASSTVGGPPVDLYQRYAREALPAIIPYLQDKGLISSWVVRTAVD